MAKTKMGHFPAKIISQRDHRYEVVFFGPRHDKTWLDHAQIKNLDMSSLKDGKKSINMKKAVEEVAEHIRNVKKRFGGEILKKLKFESDGRDIEETSPTRSEGPDDEQDESSNSSTEKKENRKRPLRSRDSLNQTVESKQPKINSDSRLFGIQLTDLSERKDESSQTDAIPEPKVPKGKSYTETEMRKAKEDERKKVEAEFQRRLEAEQKKHQMELRKTKKKQWCAVCFKEARYFCCTTAFYCTSECQRNHWQMGHSDNCKKRSSSNGLSNGHRPSPNNTAQQQRRG